MADNDAPARYRYKHLPDDAFRVIELERLDPEISFKLVEYADVSPPEYCALSYCWGTEASAESIICDGCQFKVTAHLKEALQVIFTNSPDSRLWVDAVCIDQASNAEKGAQVAKMHHIYRNATSVCVWLGRAEDGSDDAIDGINTAVFKPDPGKQTRERIQHRILNLKSEASLNLDISLFHPIASLSRRAWFQRLWIAQEYFFAQNVLFLCGKKAMDGAKFISFIRKLSIYSFGGEEPAGFQDEDSLFQGFQALLKLQRLKEKGTKGDYISFFDFVMEARERFATEAVDRIYAAFGMVEATDQVYRREIPIDYSPEAKQQFWNVYVHFGKIALQHEPHLHLLGQTSSQERPEGLPSWCPNLNSLPKTPSTDGLGIRRSGWPWKRHDVSQCSGHPHFQGEEKQHISISSTSDEISIWGADLGKIVEVGPTIDWDVNGDTEDLGSVQLLAKSLLTWLAKSEEICKDQGKYGLSPLAIFNKLLVGEGNKARRLQHTDTASETEQPMDRQNDRFASGKGAEAGDSTVTDLVVADVITDTAKDDEGDSDDTAFLFLVLTLTSILELDLGVDWKTEQPQLFRDFEVSYTWLMFIHEDWDGRLLFRTDSGFFGYASEDLRIDDTVCILYGGRTCYILRKGTANYRFVADAYVLGLMDGEAFELLDQGTVEEEHFSIC